MRSNPDRSVLVWLDAQSVESSTRDRGLSELLLGIAKPPGRQTPQCPRQCPRRTVIRFSPSGLCPSISRAEAYAEIVTALAGMVIRSLLRIQIAAIAASRRFSVATRDEHLPSRCITVINPWIGAPGLNRRSSM